MPDDEAAAKLEAEIASLASFAPYGTFKLNVRVAGPNRLNLGWLWLLAAIASYGAGLWLDSGALNAASVSLAIIAIISFISDFTITLPWPEYDEVLIHNKAPSIGGREGRSAYKYTPKTYAQLVTEHGIELQSLLDEIERVLRENRSSYEYIQDDLDLVEERTLRMREQGLARAEVAKL